MFFCRIVIYLLYFFATVISNEKLICKFDQIVSLELNKLYFIESLNFPHSMMENCHIHFVTENVTVIEETQIVLSITNGILNQFNFSPENSTKSFSFNTNTHPLEYNFIRITKDFEFEVISNQSYNAFQTMMWIENVNNKCPLHFFNVNSTPFKFKDDSEVLYISSYNFEEAVNCSWYLTAPFGYKFKIEMPREKFFNTSSLIKFDNGEDTWILRNTNHTKIYEIYGKKLSVYSFLNKNQNKFECIISITKIVTKTSEENCKIIKNGSETIWTSFGENMDGYSNNMRCTFNLTVPSKNEIMFIAEIVNLRYPDTINIYINNVPIEGKIHIKQPYYLQSQTNGFGRDVFFEFVTDGNILSEGFRLKFIEQECKCRSSQIIVPCNGRQNYDIMNTFDNHFCGNLFCKFNIKLESDCQNKNLLIDLLTSWGNIPPIQGEIVIVSNNKTLLNSTADFGKDHLFKVVVIGSRSNFITISTKIPGYFSFPIEAVPQITILPSIILTDAQPSHTFDSFPEHSVFTVMLDKSLETDFLHILIPEHPVDFSFYFDDNMTEIFKGNLINKVHGNCGLSSNVVVVPTLSRYPTASSYFIPQRVTMFSKPEGECEMIFYSFFEMLSIWTSAKTEKVKFYTSNDKFTAALDNQDSWAQISIFKPFFKVKIPAKGSIIFDLVAKNYFDKKPIKEFWFSKEYEKHSPAPSYSDFSLHIDNDTIAIFKVVDLNISASAKLYFYPQKIFFIGQIIECSNTTVILEYDEPEYGYNGVLLEIQMLSKV